MTTKLTNNIINHFITGTTAWPGWETVTSINLNDVIDPFVVPSSSQQALYFDQLKGIYNETLVTAAMAQIQFLEYSGSETVEITTITTESSDGTIPTAATAGSNPKMALMYQKNGNNNANNIITYRRYTNMSRFFGTDVRHDSRFDQTTAILSDANSICRLNVRVRHLDKTALASNVLMMRITLTQWVTFKERITVLMS